MLLSRRARRYRLERVEGGHCGRRRIPDRALRAAVIESHISGHPDPHRPAFDDAEYPERAGAFVSLHRGGSLRGCIGTILPTRPTLAEEVAGNAIQAAMADPRFPPLSAAELADLEISVDVLHAPESCTLDELDPTRYGVIVTKGWRRGLLLPDLEGVDDVATQVAIAMRKAGIAPRSSVTSSASASTATLSAWTRPIDPRRHPHRPGLEAAGHRCGRADGGGQDRSSRGACRAPCR